MLNFSLRVETKDAAEKMMGKRPEKMQAVLAQRIKTKLGDLQRRSYNGANIYVNLLSSPQDPLLVISEKVEV